jgi:hypothetical protein
MCGNAHSLVVDADQLLVRFLGVMSSMDRLSSRAREGRRITRREQLEQTRSLQP